MLIKDNLKEDLWPSNERHADGPLEIHVKRPKTTNQEAGNPAVATNARKSLDDLQIHKKASAAELLSIAKRVSSQVKEPRLDHDSLLYDENGLPH